MDGSSNIRAARIGELVGSRICHDLISPIGAISNGVELVGLGGGQMDGPEFDLIAQSVDSAAARIRFLRLSYGSAGHQTVSARDIRAALAGFSPEGRVQVAWQRDEGATRSVVRLVFLALQCLETALAGSGHITVATDERGANIVAAGENLRFDKGLWAHLDLAIGVPQEISAASVQFLLLGQLIEDGAVSAGPIETGPGCLALRVETGPAPP